MSQVPEHFRLYKDDAGEWRWSLYAANSKIIADGAEGYVNRRDAIHGINLVKAVAPRAPIWDPAKKQWVTD